MRKYLNYFVFALVVLGIGGLAVSHSRQMQSLVTDLSSNQTDRRIAAANELIKSEQFMDAINGETVAVHLAAVESLELKGDAPAVKQLLPLLKDLDKRVQARAVAALQKIAGKSKDSLNELMPGIKDGDASIKKNSIKALVDPANGIGPVPNAIPVIVDYMKKEGGARAPGGDILGSPLFLSKGSQAESIPLLIAQADDKDEGVRIGAVEALGKIGDKMAIPRLLTAMKSDTPQVRRVAIGSIALIADVSGEAALTEAIGNQDDNNEARAQAAIGLGRIGTPTAVAVLVKTLEDDDLKLRSAAVNALARAAKPNSNGPALASVLTSLETAAKSPNEGAAISAIRALQGIADQSANATLQAIARNPAASEDLRTAATLALGTAGNKAAISDLISLLSDSSDQVSDAAEQALVQVGPDAADPLIAAMSQNDTLGLQASSVLSQQGSAALPAVLKALETKDAARQRWLAVALGEMGVAEARPPLEKLSQDSNAEVAYVAKEQLNRMGLSR